MSAPNYCPWIQKRVLILKTYEEYTRSYDKGMRFVMPEDACYLEALCRTQHDALKALVDAALDSIATHVIAGHLDTATEEAREVLKEFDAMERLSKG